MTISGSTYEIELAKLSPLLDSPVAISQSEYLNRIERAREGLRRSGGDALLIGAGASLRYFTGLGWGASERLIALYLPLTGAPYLICPYFERGSIEAELKIELELLLWQEDESPYQLIKKLRNQGRLYVDPALNFATIHRLKTETNLDLCEASSIIDSLRMQKSTYELALMQYAKDMTMKVHRAAAKILHEGITTTEVKRFIDEAHRAMGASGFSFCIVQFGKATAYPHGLPGVQSLKENDLVLIDTGCTIEGYHSDITRTYSFGTPSAEERRIWDIEKEAQRRAFEAVEPGKPCEMIDYAARDVLMAHGLGPDYQLPGTPHRTGHGIGLSIHEPAYLVRGDTTLLAQGMCFSNEPMIVIPDRFGIRLEDHFYVTEQGAKWFTEPQTSILAL